MRKSPPKNFVGDFSKHKNVKRKSISKKFLNLISKKADAKVCQKIKATCLRQIVERHNAALLLLCSSVLSDNKDNRFRPSQQRREDVTHLFTGLSPSGAPSLPAGGPHSTF